MLDGSLLALNSPTAPLPDCGEERSLTPLAEVAVTPSSALPGYCSAGKDDPTATLPERMRRPRPDRGTVDEPT